MSVPLVLRRAPALSLAALAAVALAAQPPAATAAWPGVNGRISLTQRVPAQDGVRANRDIFAYARDGTRTRVTHQHRQRAAVELVARWPLDGAYAP